MGSLPACFAPIPHTGSPVLESVLFAPLFRFATFASAAFRSRWAMDGSSGKATLQTRRCDVGSASVPAAPRRPAAPRGPASSWVGPRWSRLRDRSPRGPASTERRSFEGLHRNGSGFLRDDPRGTSGCRSLTLPEGLHPLCLHDHRSHDPARPRPDERAGFRWWRLHRGCTDCHPPATPHRFRRLKSFI